MEELNLGDLVGKPYGCHKHFNVSFHSGGNYCHVYFLIAILNPIVVVISSCVQLILNLNIYSFGIKSLII